LFNSYDHLYAIYFQRSGVVKTLSLSLVSEVQNEKKKKKSMNGVCETGVISALLLHRKVHNDDFVNV